MKKQVSNSTLKAYLRATQRFKSVWLAPNIDGTTWSAVRCEIVMGQPWGKGKTAQAALRNLEAGERPRRARKRT